MVNIPADYLLILCYLLFADSGLRSSAPFGGRSLMNFLFRHSLSGFVHLPVVETRYPELSSGFPVPAADTYFFPVDCSYGYASIGLRISPINFAPS